MSYIIGILIVLAIFGISFLFKGKKGKSMSDNYDDNQEFDNQDWSDTDMSDNYDDVDFDD